MCENSKLPQNCLQCFFCQVKMRNVVLRSISGFSFATRRKPNASHIVRGLHIIHVKTYASDTFANAGTGEADPDQLEYQKWGNRGGVVHKSAFIDPTAQVEVGAVVHSRAILGADVHVGSGAVVGEGVVVGQSTKIGYNVALSNCMIGDSCVIHHGVCIGQDGYGFFVDGQGNMIKKPQEMHVRIGNFVEIGANTCIDRGSWRDTEIGDHTKIDNLVQIGHNVVIGKCCIICGQVGIAGSVTIRDYVTFGGRVAVRDHVSIVSKVRLAANSCVTKDITKPGDYGGFPTVPIYEWRRQVARQRCIPKEIPGPTVSLEGHGEREL